MSTDKQTCLDKGLEHTWVNRGFTDGGGALCFCCSTCMAWGFAGRFQPSRIRQYAEPFKSREPKASGTCGRRAAYRSCGCFESLRQRAGRQRGRGRLTEGEAERLVRLGTDRLRYGRGFYLRLLGALDPRLRVAVGPWRAS